MRRISILVILGLFLSIGIQAQISLKTEYVGNSSYWKSMGEASRVRVEDSQGSAIVYQGSAKLPLYAKKSEDNRLTAWRIAINGAYASLNNRNFSHKLVSEIVNIQGGLFHIRPLNQKWSRLANIGATFIRHLNPNLDIGGGLAINSSLGYPMAFPSFYLDWRSEGLFKINISLGQGFQISAKYIFKDWVSISLIAEMDGQMAMVEKDGKDLVFTHQYAIGGFRPEIKIGKSGFSIPLTFGVNIIRPTYYTERTLKAFWVNNKENNYYFQTSPYISIGIGYGL